MDSAQGKLVPSVWFPPMTQEFISIPNSMVPHKGDGNKAPSSPLTGLNSQLPIISSPRYQREMNSAISLLEAFAVPRKFWMTEKPFESQVHLFIRAETL